MAKCNVAYEKSKTFAIRIVNLCKYLREEKKEYTLTEQLLRCGTSIGANLAESEYASSQKDFLAKIYISLKECAETLFWLDIFHSTELLTDKEFNSLMADCDEIRRMLSATTKTIQEKLSE